MEQLAIASCTNLIDGGRVEINEYASRDIFAAACLGEESLHGARVAGAFGAISGFGIGVAVILQAMLEKIAALPVRQDSCSGKCGVTYSSQALLPS